MDVPKAPQDIELRNIIDKLAQFVARNGPEFEQMTKNKQKGNPKFGFLFGGEFFNYYQYKVTTEQTILKLKDVRGGVDNGGGVNPPPPQANQALAANTLSSMIMNAVQGINPQTGSSMGNMTGLADPAQAGLVAQWIVQHTQQQVQQQQATQGIPQPPLPPPLPGTTTTVVSMESLAQQQTALQEQIIQSEQNLNAQHLVLLHHEEAQIEAEIKKSEVEKLQREADELGVSLPDFDSILQPIMDSCTKDSISNGKTWLLNRATCKSVNDLLARYLLYKVLDEPEKKFFRKLHVIYLVNDILHHCVRKHIEGFKIALEEVVVPMFVNASLGVTEEQQSKLTKLLLIWEKKNHYFPDEIVSQLKDPANSWERYKQQRLQDNNDIVECIKNNTKTAVSTFQSQHLAFVTHAQQQIQVLEQQKQSLVDHQHKDAQATVNPPVPPDQKLITSQPPPVFSDGRSSDSSKDDKGLDSNSDHGWNRSRHDRDECSPPHESLLPPMSEGRVPPHEHSLDQEMHEGRGMDDIGHYDYRGSNDRRGLNDSRGPNDYRGQGDHRGSNDHRDRMDHRGPPHDYRSPIDSRHDGPGHFDVDHRVHNMDARFDPRFDPRHEGPPMSGPPSSALPPTLPLDLPININQPPPGYTGPPPDILLPDLTRPPPGFPPVPESTFQPEDLLPSLPYFDLPAGLMVPLIRLEDYNYKCLDPDAIRLPPPAPPSERLLAAVKAFYMPPRHENPRDSDGWEKLGLYEYFRAKIAAKKQKETEIEQGVRTKSRSPTPVRSWQDQAKSPPPKRRYSSRSRSKSRDRERNKRRSRRERSRTPEQRNERRDSRGERDRDRDDRDRSDRDDRDRSDRDRDRDRERDRDRDDSRDSARENRSPTPPSFMGVGGFSNSNSEDRLGETNKGHQLLKKMGWGGAGLGAKEQGIEQPISGGDVRDRQDQYKGVGINLNDPYENFRKSKGQAFINRMKARAEERAS